MLLCKEKSLGKSGPIWVRLVWRLRDLVGISSMLTGLPCSSLKSLTLAAKPKLFGILSSHGLKLGGLCLRTAVWSAA